MTRQHDEDLLDAALAESFPASDPPAMTIPALSDGTPDVLESPRAGSKNILLYRVVAMEEGTSAFLPQPPYSAGRWTSAGTPALYASLTAGGALLEKLAHMDGARTEALTLAVGCMPKEGLRRDAPLPTDWQVLPYRASVQRTGDRWLQGHRYLGIEVPSALIPAESNVVLDVEHPRFSEVVLLETQPLQMDARLR